MHILDKKDTVAYPFIYMKNFMLTDREKDALRHIKNFMAHQGSFPPIRKLQDLMKYKSPRTAAVIIEQLLKKKVLRKKPEGGFLLEDVWKAAGEESQTIKVPLVGAVSCGMPILAIENILTNISVSLNLAKPPHKYFLLEATGDSMNEAGINGGDLVLIRQQKTANNGDKVVALINDEATIKEYQRGNDLVILKPRSTNKIHQPIILTEDFLILGVVVTAIPNFY